MIDKERAERGQKNSSITRVRPILRNLLTGIESGQELLRVLLCMAPRITPALAPLLDAPGPIVTECRRKRPYRDKILGNIEIEGAFERKVPPPGAFLRFLIENSTYTDLQKTWIRKRKGKMGEETRRLRDLLINFGDVSARKRALLELDAVGSMGSEGAWWAFEGFTEVDCLIETEKFVLFIEGKRLEPLSGATDWFARRNQLARNLECARQYGARVGKDYALLLMTEAGTSHSEVQCQERIGEGLPHLTDQDRQDLYDHFLGEVNWQQLRGPWKLGDEHFPDTTEAAIRMARKFR